MSDHLQDLHSDNPSDRFRAFRGLMDNYDPHVGAELVSAFIRERAPGVWWLGSLCVLPIWLPVLDRELTQLPEWPFSGSQTLRLLDLAKRHPLHSAAPFADSWLQSKDWAFRFAAFRWYRVGGTMQQAHDAAVLLLKTVDSFAVTQKDLDECSWMSDFADPVARRQELLSYLEDYM